MLDLNFIFYLVCKMLLKSFNFENMNLHISFVYGLHIKEYHNLCSVINRVRVIVVIFQHGPKFQITSNIKGFDSYLFIVRTIVKMYIFVCVIHCVCVNTNRISLTISNIIAVNWISPIQMLV